LFAKSWILGSPLRVAPEWRGKITPFGTKGVDAQHRGDVVSAMRILVTGANGQVGHELLRALAGGFTDHHKSHPPQSPFLRKGEEQHPLPQEGRSERKRARSAGAEGAGGCLSPRSSGKMS
jgi:hypothetical protein